MWYSVPAILLFESPPRPPCFIPGTEYGLFLEIAPKYEANAQSSGHPFQAVFTNAPRGRWLCSSWYPPVASCPALALCLAAILAVPAFVIKYRSLVWRVGGGEPSLSLSPPLALAFTLSVWLYCISVFLSSLFLGLRAPIRGDLRPETESETSI